QGQHVGVVLLVGGEDRGVNLHLVEVVGREERAGGAVDQAGGERFLGAGAGFSFDEPARELARRVGPLAVLDLEREEVAAGVGVAWDGGGEDEGVTESDGGGPVGVLGELTGFEDESLTAEGALDTGLADRHGIYPFPLPAGGEGAGGAGRTARG